MIVSAFAALAMSLEAHSPTSNGASSAAYLVTNVSLVIASISALASAVAAVANWRSVGTARSVRESELLVHLIEKYRSEAMNAAIKAVVDASREPNWLQVWNARRLERESGALALDNHRRLIKAYFETIAVLLRGGFVRRRVAVAAVDHGGVLVFLDQGEAMERAINPVNYPRWIWDTIRPLPVQYSAGATFDATKK